MKKGIRRFDKKNSHPWERDDREIFCSSKSCSLESRDNEPSINESS